MGEDTMSLETSSLLSNAFGTSGFSWDSAKPRALSCRTPCQHTPDYRCAMSPTNPETMTKGVMFLLQSSQVKGRDLDPVGQIPSFLGNHWLLVPGTSGSPQHCSHFDSFMPHHPVNQLRAGLWRQMDNQLEAVSACRAHWHGTQTKLPGRRSPETCWRHAEWGTSFQKVPTPLMLTGLGKACSGTDRHTWNCSECACV